MPMKDLLERSDSRGGHVPYAEDFFEGPEKLFEVTFRAVEGLGPKGRVGLRTVDRQVWEEMLRLVNCEIVSVVSNSFVDAYLLSESSLFVYPRRLMIKTCGTTTLLRAVNRVLEIAAECGLVEVESLFYTRKNFLLPERQLFPHTSFADEVKVLDEIFENGTAYVLGKLNGDHLYVYMVENYRENEAPAPDQNLEILMHELDHDAAKMFYRGENFVGSRDTTIASGVQALFPTAKIDDLVFDPCGYSVNGIIDEYYFTIHVTPQPLFSFASFETNAPMKNYSNLVKQVLDIFKPGRFSVAVVANETAKCGSSHLAYDSKPAPGLVRDDKTQYDFQAYNLTYSHYEKLC